MRWRRESIIDVYELALGLFLFASPWLFAFTRETPRIESWVTGALVIVMALAAALYFSEWEEWLNAALGIWLIVAPWVLGFTHTTAMHVSIGVGIAVTYLALLELWLIHYGEDRTSEAVSHRR